MGKEFSYTQVGCLLLPVVAQAHTFSVRHVKRKVRWVVTIPSFGNRGKNE